MQKQKSQTHNQKTKRTAITNTETLPTSSPRRHYNTKHVATQSINHNKHIKLNKQTNQHKRISKGQHEQRSGTPRHDQEERHAYITTRNKKKRPSNIANKQNEQDNQREQIRYGHNEQGSQTLRHDQENRHAYVTTQHVSTNTINTCK